MEFYIASWECRDVDFGKDRERCEVIAHGKNRDGKDVCIRIPWTPFFYVEIPKANQTNLGGRSFAISLYESLRGLVRESCRVVKKKPFIGFRNGRELYFVQLVFESVTAWKRAKYSLKHTLYEAALDPLIRFFHVTDVPAAGWVRVGDSVDVESRITKSHVTEICLSSHRDIKACETETETETPPLVICSWDIEAYSSTGSFPDPGRPDDKIITIGAVYCRFGTDAPYKRSVHVLGTCNDIEGVEVHRYDKEEDVISGFMNETVRERTDFLLAWNSYGFDHTYIDGRSVTLMNFETGESLLDMSIWGKTTDPECGKIMEKQLASSAYGDNTYRYHHCPGMITIDALQIFRKETKHDSYTLDNIAKTYLGISKIDLKPWELFAKFEEEDPTGRTEIAEYCVRDCELPIALVHKMNMLNGLIEFSKVTHIPIDWLLLRGQQIRVYSLIVKSAREKGFVVPDMKAGDDNDAAFTGAIVLDPKSGGYTEDIICAMDFASLYPSIMMAHNMCGSTLVTDPQYAHLKGIDYYEIEAAPGMTVRFAQTKDNVIPGLLYRLKDLRKQAKRDMEAAPNDFIKGLLNSRQLAYKLVMNSLYGALGSNHGLLCGLKKISMSVTATGRWMIYETKRLVETLRPGSRVVYGDSVAAYTPIYVREKEGMMSITTFDALAKRVDWIARDDGKEYGVLEGLQTWSDDGWTDVKVIIRHKHTDDLVRVATHAGVVDVTQHHSLLLSNGDIVKPSEVTIGTDLLHARLPLFSIKDESTQQNRDFARIIGFFIGNGSCGVYQCASGVKYSWALNNSNYTLLLKYKKLLENEFPSFKWNIYNTMKSSSVYKLAPSSHTKYGALSVFIKEWRDMCYLDKEKIIPGFIHQADDQMKQEFINGFYDADGIKSDTMRFDQKSHITSANFFHILQSLGYTVSVSTRCDKTTIFRITGTKSVQRKPAMVVKKKYNIPYSGYVYDFTTANHHFSAGVGNMVVHNTDSVLCILNLGQENRQNLHAHFAEAERLAGEITKTFLPPHELEMEKAYFPYLLVTKKRYAGLMYEHPDKAPKIDIKGLQLVRRDSPKIVKRISHAMLEILLYERSFPKAMEYVRGEILRMLNGDVEFDEYIMSKSLRSNYKNTNLPHLIVAKKRQRRGGTPFHSGERVPFVYTQTDSDMDLGISQRAEDAEWAKDNQIPIDTLYYIKNQVMTPLVTLLQLHYKQAESDILTHRDIAERMIKLQAFTAELVKKSKRVRHNTQNKQREITSFFKRDT